jgi:hypothetical protein
VTNDGSDRAQLANIASQAKEVLGVDELEAVADRGYYSGEEILTCDKAGIAIARWTKPPKACAARACLQPHPRDEHYGHSAADGRDQGIVKVGKNSSRRHFV